MMSRLASKLLSRNGSLAVYLNSSRSLTHDRFRLSLGLPDRLNKTRELQEFKDFSFNNGRPTPVTPGQLKKIQSQRELVASAVQHLKEIKFIEDRFNNKIQQQLDHKRHIIENKLKPKGNQIVKNS